MSLPRAILIVDDEELLVTTLVRYFGGRGYAPTGVHSVAEALAAIETSLAEKQPFAAILTDLQLPDGDGGGIVKVAHDRLPHCPVLVMTGSGSVSASVEAMRLGAVTVLEKPVQLQALETEVRQAMESQAELVVALGNAEEAGIVGNSPAIRAVLDVLLLAAPTDATVLVEGETGTGKELVAQALHRLSRRPGGPFVPVNCAALPEGLLESELFGHTRGAFTGATETRQGRFRQADGGTIFLDEIGEMPLGVQSKLLRVLQERMVQPLGSDKAHPVDVRVIAASNRNLEALVAEGKFRADLFYRLDIVPLRLPPLRERAEDVAQLAAHFLRRRGGEPRFTPSAIEALSHYSWPGNVRELENLVERLTVLKPAGDLDVGDLPPHMFADRPAPGQAPVPLPPDGVDLYAVLGELEDRLIREALTRAQGNQTHAARYLCLNRTTLVEKLRKMSLR
jgi:two-component system NtrC family response regulator